MKKRLDWQRFQTFVNQSKQLPLALISRESEGVSSSIVDNGLEIQEHTVRLEKEVVERTADLRHEIEVRQRAGADST